MVFFIFLGAGYTGIAMLGCFFLLGTLATAWKITAKEKFGTAEKNKGRRTISQVLANGGVAALAGLASRFWPEHQDLGKLMMAAALAAATADTLSSELGTLYGTKFYNILSFKNDIRGENGVVSIEGTCFGLLGSICIAFIYTVGFGWNVNFVLIVVAGTVGNITDSILGATLERKHYLTNDAVNLINTIAAATSGLLLAICLK